MEHVCRHPRGLVRVVDALTVERVDAARGVADDEVGGPRLRAHRAAHRDATARGLALGLRGVDLPTFGHLVGVGIEEVGGVHGLEVAERAEQAHADVHGAVADREDPAVAGHRVAVAILDVECRFDPWFGVSGRGPVGADGGAVRPLASAERAERATESAVRAVGDHHVLGADVASGARLGLHRGAVDEATLDDRFHGFMAGEQRRACGLGVVGHHHVEVASPNDVAVARVDRVRRPPQLELATHPGRPQAIVAVVPAQRCGKPHLLELVDGARGEAVAAGFLPGKRLSLDHRHVVTVLGEPVARCRTCRTAPDHENVGGEVGGVGHGVSVWPVPGGTERVTWSCRPAARRRRRGHPCP